MLMLIRPKQCQPLCVCDIAILLTVALSYLTASSSKFYDKLTTGLQIARFLHFYVEALRVFEKQFIQNSPTTRDGSPGCRINLLILVMMLLILWAGGHIHVKFDEPCEEVKSWSHYCWSVWRKDDVGHRIKKAEIGLTGGVSTNPEQIYSTSAGWVMQHAVSEATVAQTKMCFSSVWWASVMLKPWITE